MEFSSMDFIMNTDLTNVEIALPDELQESVRDIFGRAFDAIADVAKYLYGDEYTNDQFQEAAILMLLSLRKEIAPQGFDS